MGHVEQQYHDFEIVLKDGETRREYRIMVKMNFTVFKDNVGMEINSTSLEVKG